MKYIKLFEDIDPFEDEKWEIEDEELDSRELLINILKHLVNNPEKIIEGNYWYIFTFKHNNKEFRFSMSNEKIEFDAVADNGIEKIGIDADEEIVELYDICHKISHDKHNKKYKKGNNIRKYSEYFKDI